MGASGWDTTLTLIQRIAERLPITLSILLLSLLFGLLLGFGIAVVRIQRRPIPYALATCYISFMRCTPTIVQLFLVYYGLPQLLMLAGVDVNGWDKLIFAVITFSLHSAAYFSEVIRSAYLAVGIGQLEAAYSIGMSSGQMLRRIVLPQAFGIAIPNLGNNVLILLKETSLAFSIGITDMMGQVQIILGNNYGANSLRMYMIVALMYWVLSAALERAFVGMEKRYRKGRVTLAG
ncbi:amino acid ABC transporter permease [Paenibacillus ginsengarvi]|uniref:Amino acid ABC transporter permease n=1 Tax=Paenibacillus ginsengarvi TaxID=400777 RepID=A0A3B0C6Y8_9BACL|nr:amino acid ABC transporter permease [Paenibacillus ginsengarvi]RKN80491.1 amino acid ABC transporter permease [Paenibacillus ginsengarvi]